MLLLKLDEGLAAKREVCKENKASIAWGLVRGGDARVAVLNPVPMP